MIFDDFVKGLAKMGSATEEAAKSLLMLEFNLQFFAEGSDKTEEATPKRKSEARKKGQVAKSPDLSSVAELLIVFVLLNSLGSWLYQELTIYLKQSLAPTVLNDALSETGLKDLYLKQVIFFGKFFLPLGFGAILVGVLVNVLQVGVLFTIEPLKPQFSRINPLSGLKRLFSVQGLVELVKSVVKLVIIAYLAYTSIKDKLLIFLNTIHQTPFEVGKIIWDLIFSIALRICLFLLLLAGLDYLYQRFEHRKSMRMSKQDIKEESKQTDGNPLIKNKIRQRQRQIATQRMMQEVPKADVVITNPTHLAIALRYEPGMAAPKVVAKGAGVIAQRIKEIAIEHQVTIVENKPLARALYPNVEINEIVPEEFFQAVAEVLAFVYRLKRKR